MNNNICAKNPISVLNDLKLDVKYDFVVRNGSVYNLIFEAVIVVDGKNFCGIGNSKKLAKFEAAKEALEYFTNHRKKSKNIYPKSSFIYL